MGKKYTEADVIDCAAPDDLFDSLIVSCTEKEFGLNAKSNNPQIVTKWEVLGVYNKKTDSIERELVRNGKVYIVSGLSTMPVYFTLTDKAIKFYRDFWKLANPGKPFEVDTENPDIEFLKNLAMSAVVKNVITDKLKPISEEEKEALKAEGKPLKGEPVVDDEGNKLKNKFLQIDTWNRKYMGQLPMF
jgi:hypothetical protein